MASIEYIRDRAQKAQEALAKKQATLKLMEGRIEKNLAKAEKMGYTREQTLAWVENWRDAPVDTYQIIGSIELAQDSINNAHKELPKLQAKVEEWAAKLAEAEEKEASRNVPAILQFLDLWKNEVIAYYVDHTPKFVKARDEFKAERDAIMNDRTKTYEERRAKARPLEKAFSMAWSGFSIYVHGDKLDLEALKADIDNEAKAKYDDLIAKVTHITGTIDDAAGLSVNAKGNLDGLIVGAKGTVRINTIPAAGYNIVRFHYRTLIHKVD